MVTKHDICNFLKTLIEVKETGHFDWQHLLIVLFKKKQWWIEFQSFIIFYFNTKYTKLNQMHTLHEGIEANWSTVIFLTQSQQSITNICKE